MQRAFGLIPLLLCWSPTLTAQDEDLEVDLESEEATAHFSLGGGFKNLWNAGFDSTSGSIDIQRTDIALTYTFFPAGQLSLTPFYSEYQYDFSGATPFGPRPWRNIRIQGLSSYYYTDISDSWDVRLGLTFSRAGESSARLHEGSAQGFSLFGYQVNEDLKLFGGFFHLEGIEENFTFPLFGFAWNFLEKIGIKSDSGGTRLEIAPSSAWRISLGFDSDVYQARLGPNAAVRDGILQTIELDLGLKAIWEPEEGRRIYAAALTNVFAEFELQDRAGRFVRSDNLDPGLILFLGFDFRF